MTQAAILLDGLAGVARRAEALEVALAVIPAALAGHDVVDLRRQSVTAGPADRVPGEDDQTELPPAVSISARRSASAFTIPLRGMAFTPSLTCRRELRASGGRARVSKGVRHLGALRCAPAALGLISLLS